jgi:hypothetical protein
VLLKHPVTAGRVCRDPFAKKTSANTQPRTAASIATLRCQEASNRWEEIWKRPHTQTGTDGQGIFQRHRTQTVAG